MEFRSIASLPATVRIAIWIAITTFGWGLSCYVVVDVLFPAIGIVDDEPIGVLGWLVCGAVFGIMTSMRTTGSPEYRSASREKPTTVRDAIRYMLDVVTVCCTAFTFTLLPAVVFRLTATHSWSGVAIGIATSACLLVLNSVTSASPRQKLARLMTLSCQFAACLYLVMALAWMFLEAT